MESLALALIGVCIGLVALVVYMELLRRRIDELENVTLAQGRLNAQTVDTIAEIVKAI